MIGDEAEHAFARAVDAPLGKADEFDVVIIEPFGIAFTKRFAVAHKIIRLLGVIADDFFFLILKDDGLPVE